MSRKPCQHTLAGLSVCVEKYFVNYAHIYLKSLARYLNYAHICKVIKKQTMSGFGKNLTTTTKVTRLFRKCDMANFMRDGEFCFSTEESVSLIGQGNIALVLESGTYTGEYDHQDADAGKNFGYDEFRIEFTESELRDAIEAIVISDSLYNSEEEADMDIVAGLWDYGFVQSESSATDEYKINFNF